jgi:hypothetical protein
MEKLSKPTKVSVIIVGTHCSWSNIERPQCDVLLLLQRIQKVGGVTWHVFWTKGVHRTHYGVDIFFLCLSETFNGLQWNLVLVVHNTRRREMAAEHRTHVSPVLLSIYQTTRIWNREFISPCGPSLILRSAKKFVQWIVFEETDGFIWASCKVEVMLARLNLLYNF